MRSQAANALSSLVMSLPLIAVPCLAVFGLPSIGPATAEAEADESIELGLSEELGSASSSPTTSDSSNNSFAPIFDAKQANTEQVAEAVDPPGADRSQIAPTSDRRGASANQALGLESEAETTRSDYPRTESQDAAVENTQTADSQNANPFAEVEADDDRPTDWESVLVRLRELGIHKFHITDGEVSGEFYFCCSMSSGPNVTQRFEAEAATPTAAAIDVLAQVEQCQGIR